ncbi:DUF4032 domain-containing protein [Corynebacterium imitans]|uniref:DUF4032 domain-containing protein n=1 Tax=Corynebacterium imitans TaxID=156978 RepID=UPI00254E0EF7|nr:DUF4032 domain-containing protein [Corynebacterium imitans]MDK8305438.1 DUF4032 domain-containing protein [Corynebacterium imitans]MDK8636261.1 DUF4032 domain-containing protein [Corynebacterium imitans]MDK8771459.1 DUF4032 domain-containing protein [Corynebacterium imitans]
MLEKLSVVSPTYAPTLLKMPWSTPLEEWSTDLLAALPRGISRHTVRLVEADGLVFAVKEIGERVAYHEYRNLRRLQELGVPCVVPVAVITHRRDEDGEELTPCLVTEHLRFSLPYRDVFSRDPAADVVSKLVRALAVLLVRLHLLGFYWGDVSLSNTLFRRDADQFSAYLVDAETGEFHEPLSQSRRLYDVDVARVNIIGELMDLQAAGAIDEDADVIALGNAIEAVYLELWDLVTGELVVEGDAFDAVAKRVEAINALGFDVGEMEIENEGNRYRIIIEPAVFSTGFYQKKLLQLTGLHVQDGQAQRLLGEMEVYRAVRYGGKLPLEAVAHRWMVREYEPVVALIPEPLREKLEPAQIFHEILDHRWFLSQNEHRFVPLMEAAASYFQRVLPGHRDEAMVYRLPPMPPPDQTGNTS